ncbi:MAG: macro domain-containing protein [Acidobacteria bacterium]|nr:macro domain-containing protein [Acidobacteriota bacterium]MCI0721240.1 macro domain-containing protein [Acidobacteriota bacterium]
MKILNTELRLVQGDITHLDVDSIVNAANSRLILGEGVAGAIRRKGGPQIQKGCDRIGGTPVGTAVITGGGLLKARHVIHAADPRLGEGNEDDRLKNVTLSSLRVADENGLNSIAFPAISTGIFAFPLDRCARIMVGTTVDYLLARANWIDSGCVLSFFCGCV